MKKFSTLLLILTLIITSFVPLNIGYAADLTFPYDASYTAGYNSLADDQSEANSMLLDEYRQWKAARVTSSGAGGNLRVQRGSSDSYDTVSEGIGYGMLLAVYFDDRTTFDGLWKYAKAHFNSNGLMGWHVDANGNFVGTGGSGAATDAEEDMGIALVFAVKKWGAYEQEAQTFLRNMYNTEVEKGTYVLKPGDSWGGSSVTNPSYFAPGYFRVFAEFTGNQEWLKVADKCYDILDKCRNSSTGLVPDWCTANGGQASGQGYDFKYDAIRTLWRIAVDYNWYGTPKAKTVCDAMSKFFKNGGISSIGDNYQINGNKVGNNHSSTFVACIASGAMTGYDETFAKDMYKECVKVKDAYSSGWSYFGNSLRMMVLLHITGNFPNPIKYTPSEPTPTPTQTKDPTPTKTPRVSPTPSNLYPEDINGDRAINMTDVMIIAGCFNTTRNSSKFDARCDLNNDGSVNMTDVMRIASKFNTSY